MELKDAEYQEWLALKHMEEMSYDFNKPQMSIIAGKPMDNTKLIVEDWTLKPSFSSAPVFNYDLNTYSLDFTTVCRDVRVVGTELQTYNLFCKMLDEYGWQIQDSFPAKLRDEYRTLYTGGNNKPFIINLK